MTSVTRGNRPGGVSGNPGRSTHQRRSHHTVMKAGYRFIRRDANDHNLYENDYGQRITVTGTPRNEDNAVRTLRSEIRRHIREREANVSTATTIKPATQYVAMADAFMLKPLTGSLKGPAGAARAHAFDGWLKRVLERHGPVRSSDLIEAVETMGFNRIGLQRAKTAIGAVSYGVGAADGEGKKHMSWMTCLEHQLPADKRDRANRPRPFPVGVEIEAPEPTPAPAPALDPNTAIPSPALVAVTSNGAAKLTDQQAAALMLLESVGIKAPGQEVKEALYVAQTALRNASIAVENALVSLG